jgi:hypothetical protein
MYLLLSRLKKVIMMRIFFSLPALRTPLRAFVFILAALLFTTPGYQVAHATSGPLSFDMQPLTSNPLNPVTRSYFVMDAKPGTLIQNSVLFTNLGTTSGMLKLYPVDALTAPEGGTTFYKQSDPRKDVGSWITLSQQQVILKPGQTFAVPFKVNVPPNARSGQHVGGIAADDQSVQTISARDKVDLHLQERHVLAVQVNLPGTPVEKLEVKNLHPDDSNRYQRLQIEITNTGNMMLKPNGNLQIFDSKGFRLQNLKFHIFTFLPQTSIMYPAYIQSTALPIGRYKAELTLSYGHHNVLSTTASFTIKAKQQTIPNAISTLVTLGDSQEALSLLTPWQLAIGGIIALILLSALAFWFYKLFTMLARTRNKNKQSAETREVVHAHTTLSPEEAHANGKENDDASYGQNPH